MKPVAVAAAALLAAALAPAAAAAGAPRPLAAKCFGSPIRARPFWLTAADGVRLYAFEAGTGPVSVVLVHESPADLCGWLPYAKTLVAAGIRVLAFDLRGFGDSDRPAVGSTAYGRDLAAAVARLRADGATHVFLVGASFGGAAVMTYGPTLDVDGVVSMSGEASLPASGLDAAAHIHALKAPLLILGSRHDRYLPVSDALMLLRRAGAKDKRTALYPGGFHGWDLVEDAPYAARARALVLAWLRKRA
jgi:alpha-beta hydrolase superfamily lysophospholipase